MKTKELREATTDALEAKLDKLASVIATHPQRSMRASAVCTKLVVLKELLRREQTQRA